MNDRNRVYCFSLTAAVILLLLGGMLLPPGGEVMEVLAQEPMPTSTRSPLSTPATEVPETPPAPPPTAAPTRPPDPPAPAPAATATPTPAIVLPVAGRTRGWVAGGLLLGGLAILIGGLLLHVRRR